MTILQVKAETSAAACTMLAEQKVATARYSPIPAG